MHICKSMVHFFDETERKSEKFNEKKENEQGNDSEFEKIHEPTWMCGNVKMWISTNRALAAKKCGSEHLAAIFCPSLLHLLPISSPPQASLWHVPFLQQKGTCHIIFFPTSSPSLLLHGLFLFGAKREHAKFCAKVEKNLKYANRESRFWEKYGGKMQFLTGIGKTDGV